MRGALPVVGRKEARGVVAALALAFPAGAAVAGAGAAGARAVVAALALACLFSAGLLSAAQGEADYRIGPRDVLAIKVFNRGEVSGEYRVGTDGAFSFPLIGRVDAAGLTVQGLEEALKARLAAGYFRNPDVTVSVASYVSRRVFVVGEVREPGAYPLAADESFIEVLARAGSVLPWASEEAVIVRADARSSSTGPRLPREHPDAETVRVDLRALEDGGLARNLMLRAGDTIFIPRAAVAAPVVFVFGAVRSPGSYTIRDGTTVRDALSLAGGLAASAALDRISIVRIVNGGHVEVRVRPEDVLEPGDTMHVPAK